MTVKQKINEVQNLFLKNGIDASDAKWLVSYVLGPNFNLLSQAEITKKQENKINKLAKLRLKRIPLSALQKSQNFYGLNFYVNNHVLTPRFETEGLCEIVKNTVPNIKEKSGLDIGTGSGAIAVVLSKLFGAKMTAVDKSIFALFVARKNAKTNNAKIIIKKSNLFSNLKNKKFDFIVSNPPYVTNEEYKSLEPEVKKHDPKIALVGKNNGLQFYEKIISQAPKFLNPNGYLFFEIGYLQANAVSKMLENNFKNIKIQKDLQNKDRYVFAQLK